MAAFCSWKRSCNRADPFICLSTQRRIHCSSRLMRDLVVKSLTQSSKHRWTILEYIWTETRSDRGEDKHGRVSRPSCLADDLSSGYIQRTVINSFICLRSMRDANSRCSDALRLLRLARLIESKRQDNQKNIGCSTYPSILGELTTRE